MEDIDTIMQDISKNSKNTKIIRDGSEKDISREIYRDESKNAEPGIAPIELLESTNCLKNGSDEKTVMVPMK